MKIMGLDVGDKTIGVAISDTMEIIAHPVENYRRVGAKHDVAHIVDTIVSEDVNLVVVGMPYNMNGTIGPQAEKTMAFAKKLEKKIKYTDKLEHKNITIEFYDERLSSKEAENTLIKMDMRREKRKSHIDMVASTIILQSYLDYKGRKTNE